MGAPDVAARPLWRGRLHFWAAIVGVPAGVALVLSAHGAAATTAAALFAASVVLAFGTSAAYHRGRWSARARSVMQRLDHTMIYILIAGSYVPVSLLAMPRAWGICVLAVVTAGAVLGMLRSLVAFDRWRAVGIVLYVVLGWTALAAMPVLVTRLTAGQLLLFVLGGVLYTAGLPILLTHRPNPWPRTFGYHEIWHTFTVAAVACHFGGVQLLVR